VQTIRIKARLPKRRRRLGLQAGIVGGSNAVIRFGANFRWWRHGGDAARAPKRLEAHLFYKLLI
jgi:hypothetical protein